MSALRSAIRCSRCTSPLAAEGWPDQDWRDCPFCGTPTHVRLYPASFAGASQPMAVNPLVAEGEASCFYHADRRAVVPCDSCGRYLCALCQIEWGDFNYCPACLEAGEVQRRMPQLENSRVHYDSIALALATIPVVTFYFVLITAPLTLFVVWRNWNRPLSLIPRTKVRFWIAAVLAVLEIAGIAAAIFALIYVVGHRTGIR